MNSIFYFSVLLLLFSCQSNSATKSKSDESKFSESSNNNLLANITDQSFKSFVSNFKIASLPIDLKARKDWNYDVNNNVKELSEHDVKKFICLKKDNCFNSKNQDAFYPVGIVADTESYLLVLYYKSESQGHHYMLATYSHDGNIIETFEISGLVGDKYEQDGYLDSKLLLNLKRLSFQFSNDNKEIKETTEKLEYKINETGKFQLLNQSVTQENIEENK